MNGVKSLHSERMISLSEYTLRRKKLTHSQNGRRDEEI